MNVFDNRTTRRDNKKSNNKHFYHISMSIIKKIITEPKLHQRKTKPDNINHTSLKKMRDLSLKRLVNRSTKKKYDVQEKVSIFENK